MNTDKCPHLSLVLSITKAELLEKAEKGICNECREKGPKLWACLQGNCCFIGCGESAYDHSSKHYKAKKHSVTVNLRTFRVWCYSCNREVHLSTLFTAAQMKELKRNSKAKKLEQDSQKASSQDSMHSSILHEETPDVPLGLTGLRNIGNTCYMNASLQSLSNCLQLTHYFLNQDAGETAPPMTKSYRKLVQDVWNNKRPSCLTPSSVHMALKLINPAFRGYQQQDAQEFLRCIMDRLHEELKYAVSRQDEYQPVQTSLPSNSPNPSARYSAEPIHSQLLDLHGTTAQQNSNNTTKIKSKRHLHDLKSIISEIFDGKLRSSVQCLTCDQVSHTRETFQDLSLPIPGKDDLSRLHGATYLPASGSTSLPIVPGFKGPCAQQASTTEMLYSIWDWLKSWVWGPYITLNDCLAAFFSSDELKGDNMYSCDKCKKLRNGVKYCRLLELPEVVCIHLKRFRHEYLTSYSTKISSPVYFPLKGLDLRPYLAQDSPSHCTKYDLFAVIVHLGNAGGGHYMAYAKNITNKKWYEFDDQYVTEVPESTVANVEAYVLFYSKTSAESLRARDRIWGLFDRDRTLSTDTINDMHGRTPPLMQFLVSVHWLHKFSTFAEPGPIDNRDFVCIHGAVLPDKFDQLESMTVLVSEQVWAELRARYGGGPSVTKQHAQPCETCRLEFEELENRRTSEREQFIKCDEEVTNAQYFISMAWFKQWERFLHSKNYDPPGEIDNSSISIVKDSVVHLKQGSDSGPLTPAAWKYLHSVYGGGPAISVRRFVARKPIAAIIKQPVADDKQAIATDNQPVATDSQSIDTNNQPVATGNQPVATVNQPVATVNQAVSSDNQQGFTGSQPIAAMDNISVLKQEKELSQQEAMEIEEHGNSDNQDQDYINEDISMDSKLDDEMQNLISKETIIKEEAIKSEPMFV